MAVGQAGRNSSGTDILVAIVIYLRFPIQLSQRARSGICDSNLRLDDREEQSMVLLWSPAGDWANDPPDDEVDWWEYVTSASSLATGR